MTLFFRRASLSVQILLLTAMAATKALTSTVTRSTTAAKGRLSKNGKPVKRTKSAIASSTKRIDGHMSQRKKLRVECPFIDSEAKEDGRDFPATDSESMSELPRTTAMRIIVLSVLR